MIQHETQAQWFARMNTMLDGVQQQEQMDPTYLAAVDELGKVQGMGNILVAAKFTAAVFGKTLSQVVIDACDQSAAAGGVFGS